MRYWFTADLHLNHTNIIRYCNRPFKNIGHMNEELIRRWNERVKPEDIVFCIGDFCFRSKWARGKIFNFEYWQSRLNGNIIFIKGNHDTKTKIHSLVIKMGKQLINLTHYWYRAGINYDINLTAHCHNKWEIKRIKKGNGFTDCINVGVDVWDFYPVSFKEIMQRYAQWKKFNYFPKNP